MIKGDNRKKTKSFLLNASVICFVIICCSGFSFLMPYRIALIGLFAITMVILNLQGSTYHFYKSQQSFWFLIFLLLMIFGITFSFDKVQTIKYSCVYLVGLVLILNPTKENLHYKIFGGISICTKFIAFSIIVNLFIPNLFSEYLFFLIRGGSSAVSNEVNNHIFSGLMGEKGEAAFIMVVAIILLLANCAAEMKVSKKNAIWLCILFVALILPAKRMLFVIGILMCMLYLLFWTSGKKKLISIGIFGSLASIGYIVVSNIPTLNTLLERFVTFSEDKSVNGRTYLWEYAIEMYRNKPWLGYGYGSFNSYASLKGVILTSSREWVSQAHNIYFQLLGEVGIIGTIFFLLIAILGVSNFIQVYKRRSLLDRNDFQLLFLGGNIQVLILVYGLSGNCIYYTNQMMLYFWSLALMVFLKWKYGKAQTKIRRSKISPNQVTQ